MLSLSAAVSIGIEAEQIINVLVRLAKNEIDEALLAFVREQGKAIGKLKMVLRNNRHYLEAVDLDLLRKLCSDQEIKSCLLGDFESGVCLESRLAQQAAPSLGLPSASRPEEVFKSIEVNSLHTETIKAAAHRMKMPLLQEYEYKLDQGRNMPELEIALRPTVSLRPYQQRSLAKMFSMDGVAKSGIVVLPCGAGKTLVGIAAAARVKRRTLVLTTTAVAVDQWRRQFIEYTTIPPERVYCLTAEHKRMLDDAEDRACVLVSTYSMMGFGGKRSGETEYIMEQIQDLDWGLLVVDEVQVMPARTFRSVATTVKAHCCLGLTATLVREDDLIKDLHWLIGPKLFEANWQQLQEDGYIARVRCVEVWCDMAPEFFGEYLKAIDAKNEHLRRALWVCNPNKLKICDFLIRFHEDRGDKVIVFSDNVMILESFAKQLGRYFICGKVAMQERMQILTSFKETSTCNTIFLSKVGDNAIDIPNASVIIQISAHYGSRRQEAQRLGRILRPKPRNFESKSKFNAFFYSLVSRDTQEMYYANRRQQFLVEQGYNYHVLRDSGVERMLASPNLCYSGPGAKDQRMRLLADVLASVKSGEGRENDEDDVALHDAALAGRGRVKVEGGPPARSGGLEERISMASLSGGLDGSYSVSSVFKGVKQGIKVS